MTMPKVPAIDRLDPAAGLLAAAAPVEPLFARRTDERFLGAFDHRVFITRRIRSQAPEPRAPRRAAC
jgi:hypothetical protein